MVPLRLTLRNFLSYGEATEPIELDGIHVACLCGQNGHGKSALLDAITWALWGQARSNTADDLVRLGQREMQVDLEFLLDGLRYRVIRKRTKGKTGQSDLQFQVSEPGPTTTLGGMAESEGAWRALTGQGVRETQARIVRTLRMDYDTFINSAFILQGRADEFARKSPSDRKKVLSEILNLGQYDQLSEAARARRTEAQTRAKALDGEINRLEAERAREPQLRVEAERLAGAHAAAQTAVEHARAVHQEILVEKTRLDARRRERDDLLRRLSAAEAELRTQNGLLDAARKRVAGAEVLCSRADAVRARAAEQGALAAERDRMGAALAELRKLEGERAGYQRSLQEAEHGLRSQLLLEQKTYREVAAQAKHLPRMKQELAELEAQEKALDRLQEGLPAFQQRLTELAGEIASAQAEERRVAEALEAANERFQKLKSAHALCPLCEGDLPDEKRKELGRKLRREMDDLKLAQGAALNSGTVARREEAETQKQLRETEAKLRSGQHMRNRLAQVRQQHLQLTEAEETLPTLLAAVEGLERQLKEAVFAPEVRRGLAGVEERIALLSFDEGRRRQVQGRLQELAGADRDLHTLEQAEADLPVAREQVRTLEAALRAREEAIAEDRAARLEADRDLARAGEVDAETARRELALRQSERNEAELARQVATVSQALARCEELAVTLTERRGEQESASKEATLHEELAKAFGRNGIQALIIENALPEVEAEANDLLQRMTEGALNVRLRTQKELKGGGQAETLEIEISDGMGARRYELYSGGEAFRVNFALRIALSRLLAQRAGARLETLVIDEGFGSQDEKGRDRIVEAIHAIQDQFARILVITHLDELKEAFPTRIEVTKSVLGSQVSVY